MFTDRKRVPSDPETRDLFCPHLCLLSKFTHVGESSHANMSFRVGGGGRQPSASQLSIGQITLGCTKQPADSQRRSDRARRCSRRTRGPPSASLLSSKSPSSPRRRSSEEGEEEADKKKRRLRRGRRSFKEFYSNGALQSPQEFPTSLPDQQISHRS